MMTFHDFPNKVLLSASRFGVAVTSDGGGTGVDMLLTDGVCFAVQSVGTTSGTSPTLDSKIQESDDDSTYTDVSGATFAQVTAASNLQVIRFQRTKRYVRIHNDVGGTSPSFVITALIGAEKKILGGPGNQF